MTVIYSNFGDVDTKVLETLWEGLDAKVVELSKNNKDARRKALKAIEEEKDTILFCGHGSGYGLWDPAGGYVISPMLACRIAAKNIIGVWCHARDYAKATQLRGFYTSMFISNEMEEQYCGVEGTSAEDITKSEVLFCERVNQLLKDNVPLSEWLDILQGYPRTNTVEEYNYSGFYYHD